ncbi:hypothetical protein [Candidatus Magnetobacterium casense]|uniref:Uncharacterized protein n=1 Tax=Candidatus Magnetobacterium casense TaxID=1455061 RepID=A0ABS6S4J9_9BACT|nr:hypothetical protein [Candidatus Magnetobacterium casensis]MBV6343774.1 hypothetical protein [Candidatus Magnetobacterium casensis]
MTDTDLFYKNGLAYIVQRVGTGWRCTIKGRRLTATGWGATKRDAIIAAELEAQNGHS